MSCRRWAPALLLLSCLSTARPAWAAPPSAAPSPEVVREAGKHFQRGVALFNEADYAGALAEFKKAHEIAPNPAVLYNIGQTHFQLRSYAAALTAFEKYLAEAPSNADHRAEASANVETLRARVGKIDVNAPPGTEVSIDDEVAGATPLPPVLAAVGRRKVTLFKDGAQQVRFVEVSAGETVKLEVKLAGPEGSASPTGSPPTASTASSVTPSSSTLPTVLFIAAGALAVGAVTTGIVSLGASSDLEAERTKPAGQATRQSLDDLSSKTSTFALVTDVLAGAAIVTGGVALYLTITRPSEPTKGRAPTARGVGLSFSPTSVGLSGRF